MANKFTRETTSENQREEGKTLQNHAPGVRARLDAVEGATIDDLGKHPELQLRPDDNRDSMITAVRADAAKKYKFAIVERSETESGKVAVSPEPLSPSETDPKLSPLQKQYDALSEADRTYNGRVRSWAEVAKAIPNMPDFFAGVETLIEAQVYFLNDKGQLIVGEGCAEPPRERLDLDYYRSRTQATRISYIDNEGQIKVINGDDTEIPSSAKILSERGLVSLEEYKRVNKGQFEKEKVIWTESGKNPSVARDACWDNGFVASDEDLPDAGDLNRGSRRVLRVNLNFES